MLDMDHRFLFYLVVVVLRVGKGFTVKTTDMFNKMFSWFYANINSKFQKSKYKFCKQQRFMQLLAYQFRQSLRRFVCTAI